MFCGAHVCQLAAKDVTSMFENALNNIRKVAIESKKVAYIQTFENLKKPRLDIAPRWDSTFLMIEDFPTQKHIAALVLDPRFCFTSGHQLFNTEMLNRGTTHS